MLIVLPLLCFLSLLFHLNGVRVNEGTSGEDWRGAFLRAVVILGVLLVIAMEGLTLFSAINQIGLAMFWLIVLLVIIWLGLRKNTLEAGFRDIQESVREFSRIEAFLVMAIIAIATVLLLIAIIAPPNNVDSLLYHMPRVVHWAQNESLRHYPTAKITQVIRPNFAELSILNLRVLWGSDRPANLVQWFSMVGSVIAVSAIASQFGTKRLGQILAAAFAISLPMVILQSTSTQNDLFAAMWVIILAYFMVLRKQVSLDVGLVGLLGATLGLGILTKGTFFPYAIPLMIWFFIFSLSQLKIPRILTEVAIIVLAVVLLNVGFWARNVSSFGDLYGPPGSAIGNLTFFPIITNILGSQDRSRPLDAPDEASDLSATPTGQDEIENNEHVGTVSSRVPPFLEKLPARLVINTKRTAQLLAMNSVTPVIGKHFIPVLERAPEIFPQDFIDSLRNGLWNHEDTAGSFFHLLIIIMAVPLLLFISSEFDRKLLLAYGFVSVAGLILLTLISASVYLYSIRYQLGFFLLCAPLVGVAYSELRYPRLPIVLSLVLLVFSLPYLFLNNTRPLVSMAPERTRVGSIFVEPIPNLIFANVKHLQDEYYTIRDDVEERGCKDVGLQISARDAEYLFWWIFRAPQSGTRFEVLNGLPELSETMDPEFQPCAIMCTNCSNIDEIHGFSKSMDYGRVQLFLSEGDH